ncbi:tumor necrosis factor receptor superfamily member 11B [Pelobates fuscus]|uniref:tumor necrosis factor receptor superfamily member 11B n=1 Tax=Pelobates fuscus TaxID=191477 RepID=UPI002FE4A69F
MFCLWSCVLLLLFHISTAIDTYPHQYYHNDLTTFQHLLCDQCPPGEYVKHDCTVDQKTQCTPCPSHHYTDTWNSNHECQFCSAVCKELQYVKQECNGTHNRVCECMKGHYLYLEFCDSHTQCPPGFGVAQLGTPDSDTVCKKCPKGTFSDVTSASAPCQKHRDCEKLGLKTKNKGNSESDVQCEENTPESTPNCELDVTLCEEALFRFSVNVPNWLTILAQGLPGAKVMAQQLSRIKQSYNPEDQPFYLFKLWKEQNKAQYPLFHFIQGIEVCEKGVLKHVRNLNLTVTDLTDLMRSLHGKKIEKDDIENTVKTCDPPKQILKLLNLFRNKNEGNTLKILNLLKTRQLKKPLRRRMKKLKLFLNSDSMYRMHQKFVENIVNQAQPDKLNSS